MDANEVVRGHYSRRGLEETIDSALTEAGMDPQSVTASDLAPMDELHAGGVPATGYLLEQLQVDSQTRLLDVGCGIGGPARLAAATYQCSVVGIDLSPDFVGLGQRLTERVGLDNLVELVEGSGDRLAYEDASFDRAMMIHVGMNIPDKAAVFAEVRRVLRPDGLFGLFEQVSTGSGSPAFPLPWATDEQSSFVETAATYAELLANAGFAVERTEDRTAAVAAPPAQARLSPAAVFGPGFAERVGNNIAAFRDRILAPIVIVARAI
jgi:MPBQ/MSBQ methyltransferase